MSHPKVAKSKNKILWIIYSGFSEIFCFTFYVIFSFIFAKYFVPHFGKLERSAFMCFWLKQNINYFLQNINYFFLSFCQKGCKILPFYEFFSCEMIHFVWNQTPFAKRQFFTKLFFDSLINPSPLSLKQ